MGPPLKSSEFDAAGTAFCRSRLSILEHVLVHDNRSAPCTPGPSNTASAATPQLSGRHDQSRAHSTSTLVAYSIGPEKVRCVRSELQIASSIKSRQGRFVLWHTR